MAVALNANALITLAELDLILGITIGDADKSNMLINFASDFIEKYVGMDLNSKAYAGIFFDGTGDYDLFLPQFPIVSITSIESWDTYNNVTSQSYDEYTDYLIHSEEGIIYNRNGWARGKKNYKITYDAGYATIPYDVKTACAQLAGWLYSQPMSSGVKSETIGTYSITYGNANSVLINGLAIPAGILSLLVGYKKQRIAGRLN